jgi:hypothetical protein
MLQYSKFPQPVNLTSSDRPAGLITGRELNHLIRTASAPNRALLARELEQGQLRIVVPTRRQAAGLAHVSTGYVTTVGSLAQEQRLQLACGLLSLSDLHNRRRSIDTEIDRIVAKYGAERIMAALERATALSTSNG